MSHHQAIPLDQLSPEAIEREIYNLKRLEAIEAARNSLGVFMRLAWPVIEPTTALLTNWHIDAVSEHLEACTRGEIKKLIINIPPRHLKSIQVSVIWPSWVWIKNPGSRWIFGSYSHTFALRDAVRMRDIIKHPSYQNWFKPDWQIKEDQDQKTKFENTKRGYRFTTSVGGGLTGEGGDFLVVDDPTNAIDANSQVALETAILWWTQAMSTRGNQPDKTVKVVVMQRLNEKDLSGHLLKEGGYEHLVLPAEFDKVRKPTSIGWTDPRKVKGELLHPARVNAQAIADLKKDLGTLGAQAQLQQDPRPSEGGLFKRHWWKLWRELPESFDLKVQFWDCAEKPGITNDHSVCATWAKRLGDKYALDLWRGKVEAPDLENLAVSFYNKERPHAVVIEDKSHGSALIQYLRRKHPHIPVIAYNPGKRSKEVRATAATPTVESGTCWLPFGAPWVEAFINEHERFPLTDEDDQVDTTSMMVDYFLNRGKPEPRIRTL